MTGYTIPEQVWDKMPQMVWNSNLHCDIPNRHELRTTSHYKDLQLLEWIKHRASGRRLVLSFEELQLSRIEKLQEELCGLQERKAAMVSSGQFRSVEGLGAEKTLDEEIDVRLEAYATALRNYDILSQDSVPLELCARILLPKRYRIWRSFLGFFGIDFSFKSPFSEFSKIREVGREIRREREARRLRIGRFVMGVFGGVALLVPVIIMVLVEGVKTSLVTTSVATVLFAEVLVVFGRNLDGQDVLSATTAYAAVLVVFIGTLNSSS